MSGKGDHRDLVVWDIGMELAVRCYRLTSSFPAIERFGLVSQIRRAAVSIPANIAEGHGRNKPGEFLQFLGVANGSLKELETHLTLATRLELISSDCLEETLQQTASVGRMLTRLRQSLRRKLARY